MNEIIVICGPTASGKTALAVELAKAYGGEVISADSMQIYKGIDVATAKPTEEETQGIPHHLIGFLDPSESFSVADYVKLCGECAEDIRSRGKTVIICGGTGLYISAFVDNLTFDDSRQDFAFRGEMRKYAEENGNAALLEKLKEVDPETAAALHENNVGRVIRALEVVHTTGHTISQAKALSHAFPSPYKFIIISLEYRDREQLRDRINKRVDAMMENGLSEEAENWYRLSSEGKISTAAQAIGCKELYPYFDGEKTLSECVETLKLRTRQYAKRQMTWFRRDKRIQRLIIEPSDKPENVIDKAKAIIDGYR